MLAELLVFCQPRPATEPGDQLPAWAGLAGLAGSVAWVFSLLFLGFGLICFDFGWIWIDFRRIWFDLP